MSPINTLLTIGHSTRSIDEFIELLKVHGVKEIVDVRSVPKSRHCPQFNSDSLSESLRKAEIRYTHIEKLGGLRHSRKDSINLGWRKNSFRGYADYMATREFAEGRMRSRGLRVPEKLRSCAPRPFRGDVTDR